MKITNVLIGGEFDIDEGDDEGGREPDGECSKCGCLSYELGEDDVKKMLKKGKKK